MILLQKGFDMVIIRELIGGMYFGDRGRRQGETGLRLMTQSAILKWK